MKHDADITGRLFNVQHFAVHDGPGIRTTAFLQGCPIRCPWCHNPEGFCGGRQFFWYEERCRHCGACVLHCPSGALSFAEDGRLRREPAHCLECGTCAEHCHYQALESTGLQLTAGDLARQLMKDRVFYEVSGGGVTFSGGEPLLQAPFVAATARLLKAEGPVHVAVDTSGAVPWSAFAAVLPLTDLFLYDIKQTDAVLLEQITGASLPLVIGNLARLSGTDAVIDLRVPLIQGFNLNEQAADGLINLVKTYRIRRLHLIPYHRHGEKKYERLGRQQDLPHYSTPDNHDVDQFKTHLAPYIEVRIGG